MEVELLAGVIRVNVLAVPPQVIDRVLDGPDAARRGVLGDADRVAEAPAEQRALEVRIRALPLAGAVGGQRADVEGAQLRVAGVAVGGGGVVVALAAARHEQHVRVLAGQQQRAGNVARVGHVGDERAGGRGVEAGGGGVVGPRVDVVGGRGVERAAILGEGDAVVELELVELAMGV